MTSSGKKTLALALAFAGVAAALFLVFRDEPDVVRGSARPSPVAAPTTTAPELASGSISPVVSLAPPPVHPVESERRPWLSSGSDAGGTSAAKGKGATTKPTEKEETTTVRIVARDSVTHRPVTGAWVQGEIGNFFGTVDRTEGHGEAALKEVPIGKGPVDGKVRHARYERPGRFKIDPRDAAHVAPGTRGGIPMPVVTLTVGKTVLLQGTIHDTIGGAPSRATLELLHYDLNDPWTTVVTSAEFDVWDETGKFRYDVAPDVYCFRASAPGFCEAEFTTPVTFSEASTPEVNLVLERVAKVTGVVVLPPELASPPRTVELDLDVELTRPPAEPTRLDRKLTVAPDGTYHVSELRPGMYRLRPHDDTHPGRWTSVTLSEGEEAPNVVLYADAR